MAQDHDAMQHRSAQAAERDAVPLAPEGLVTPESAAIPPGTLLDNPHVTAHRNAPVRQAALQRMQQSYGNRATRRYLQRRVAPVQRHPLEEGPRKEEEERPQPVQAMRAGSVLPAVQREGAGDAAPPASSPPAAAPAGGPAAKPASGLIVEDSVADPQPNQMKRSAFVAQLRTAVEAAANEAVSGTPYASMVRPELERRLAQYSGLSAQALEQTIRQQVPEAAGATTAAGLIPAVATRVRQAVREQLPQGGAEGALAEGAAAVSDVAQGAVSAVSSAVSSVVGLFFKAHDGGPRPGGSAAETAAQLGPGTSLPGEVRSGLEGAYGADFSGVRVHTDSTATRLADSYNARAFTVGQDIAFGAGEYQPGTPVGDALIAHEVAHVVQQGQGAVGAGVQAKGSEGEAGLEEDADQSAMGAVLSMWGGARSGLTQVAQNTMPALRSGLRLQRCGRGPAPAAPAAPSLTQRIDNIRAQLRGSPTGAAALAVCDKYHVAVQFGAPGGGYFFYGPTNTITLDPNLTDSFLVPGFVHEANHARYFHEGRTANTSALLQSLSRDEYVRRMLAEETESTVLQIETKLELEGGSAEIKATGVPLENEYRTAYNASVTTQRAAKPDATDAEVRPAAREAARAAVLAGFQAGRARVSTPGHETYPDFYGKAWDAAHPH